MDYFMQLEFPFVQNHPTHARASDWLEFARRIECRQWEALRSAVLGAVEQRPYADWEFVWDSLLDLADEWGVYPPWKFSSEAYSLREFATDLQAMDPEDREFDGDPEELRAIAVLLDRYASALKDLYQVERLQWATIRSA